MRLNEVAQHYIECDSRSQYRAHSCLQEMEMRMSASVFLGQAQLASGT